MTTTTRGFAGGLADGLNQGMQLYAMNEGIKSRRAQDERAAAEDQRSEESHALKMKEASNVENMTQQWAQVLGWKPEMASGGSPMSSDAPSFGAPPEQQTPSSSVKLAGPMPQGGLAMNAPAAPAAPYAADNPLPGLSPQPPAQPPAQPAQPPMSAAQYIQKQVLQGDAFSNPEVLNKLAAISFANNQGQQGLAFLNQAHTATEKGWVKALGSLVMGDGKGAAEVLRSRGLNIEGDLTPVEGKPNTWKATINGQEKEIDARQMAMSANPMEAYKMQAEAQERQRKADLDEREIQLKERGQNNDDLKTAADVKTASARQGLLRANTERAGRTGTGNTASPKDIKEAKDERKAQFDRLSMVDDGTGKQVMDPKRRNELDRATYAQQSMLESELGGRLSGDQHRELTDSMQDFPMDKPQPGDNAGMQQYKAKVAEWQKGVLNRFGLDSAEEDGQAPAKGADTGALGGAARGKTPAAAPAAALKSTAEPTREEKELDAVRFDTKDRQTMRELQTERTAGNLSPQERADNASKIADLLAKHAPKGGLDGGSGFGKRRDGTDKGNGFLGVQTSKSGNKMTEYTVGININGKERDVPTLVPGLSKKELDYLKTEPDLRKSTPMNDAIVKKAEAHARKRISQGKSVYADEK